MDKILIVDDDRGLIEALRLGLRKYSSQFETICVLSADEAIQIMKRESIAVLVTDLVMPGKDGLDLFAYKDQFHPGTQCIIMTGYGTDELKQIAQLDGAFCYFQKPVKLKELADAILRAMEASDDGTPYKPILMNSLMKLVKVRKKTCILELVHANGQKGTIHFISGVLFGAKIGEAEGIDASLKIMTWNRVNFRFRKFPKKDLRDRVKSYISYLIDAENKAQNQFAAPKDQAKARREMESAVDIDQLVEETLKDILDQELDEAIKEELDDELDDMFGEDTDDDMFGEATDEVSDSDEVFDGRSDKGPDEFFDEGLDEVFDEGFDDQPDEYEPDEYEEIPSKQKLVRLLIVDDSKMMRKAIRDIFSADDEIQIVGECENGKEALEMIQSIDVDVMTLDVEMPVMDGLTTLKHLMIKHPTPAVMVSSLTHDGASATFDALKLGAIDFVPKPSRLAGTDLAKQSAEIIKKVKLAADVEIHSVHFIRGGKNIRDKKQFEPSHKMKCRKVFAIGAAEGGYGSLLKIIPRLPAEFHAACLVMLHAASTHVNAFVQYLDQHSSIKVKRASNGEPLHGGTCYFGSMEEYLTIQELSNDFFLHVSPSPTFRSPSNINIMMFSVAEMLNEHATGVILSGSGTDGGEGIEEIGRAGGTTIVQAPKSCIYKEMSESVLNRFSVDKVIPDNEIALAIINGMQ